MRLSQAGEVGFIREIRRRYRSIMPPPPAGPGDDAAVDGARLLTTDALIEGEHFLRSEPPALIGRKALAVNLSDIAAMGGTPVYFLLSLGLPADLDGRYALALLDGMAAAAAEHGVRWVGGDTVRSSRGVVIAITLLGRRGRALLTRSRARPGDGIYVTGPLGASAAGRALLDRGWSVRGSPSLAGGGPADRIRRRMQQPSRGRARKVAAPDAAETLSRHLDPRPRLDAGRFLSSAGLASAAIDLSDGLSLDLRRVCEASGVGARLYREAIPIAQATRRVAARLKRDPLELALDGGEDYELLFTAPKGRERKISAWPARAGPGPIFIGRITAVGHGLRLEDPSGRSAALPARGYDPFLRGR